MLKQYDTKVLCRKDGKEKTFYYTMVKEQGKPDRIGLRYGCNDKMICDKCRECWLEVKKKIASDY